MSKLSDIADFNPTRILKKGSLAPFIEMASLPTNARYVEKIEQKQFNGGGAKFKNGDVLFARITPCLENGKTAQVFELDNGEIGFGSTEFIVLSAKNSEFDQDYLYYFSRLSEFRQYAQSRMEGTSGRQRVSWQSLAEFEFDFPDQELRKSAGEILKEFDQKIQLNTQINQTLEQIAQAIFKSWFIDFDPVKAKAEAKAQGSTDEQANIAAMSVISGKSPDQLNAYKQTNPTDYQQLHQLAQAFPSEFEEIDGVEVPKGWGIEKLDDLFDVGIGKTPPRKEPEWFTEDPQNIEWISIKDMGNQGTFITNSSEYLTKEAIEKFNIRLIPENTAILSFKLTLGRVSITTKETTTNEAIAHFKVKKDTGLSSEFLYLYLKQFNFDSLGSSSSIATAINSKNIKNIPIIYPNRSVLAIFNKRIRGLFNEMRNLTENSNELAKCRDLLLPKLLSGELGV